MMPYLSYLCIHKCEFLLLFMCVLLLRFCVLVCMFVCLSDGYYVLALGVVCNSCVFVFIIPVPPALFTWILESTMVQTRTPQRSTGSTC